MQPFKWLWLVLLFPLLQVHAQEASSDGAYGVLASSMPVNNSRRDSVLTFFKIADSCMDQDRYDLAEYWLGRVGDSLSFKSAGIFNYYYHSRQAEVFYYNNLLQMGLQQSNRALQIAKELEDSIFMADAWNFLGLFSLNLEKYETAEAYLLLGLQYINAQRKPERYVIPLSEPHHLHGNLGETYVKLGKYKQALLHFDSSISKAASLGAIRAQSLGYISAGEVLMAIQRYDSAQLCLQKGRIMAARNMDNDVALLGFGNLAMLYTHLNQKADAYAMADSGMAFHFRQPLLNPFYTLLFMQRLVDIYRHFGDFRKVAEIQTEILDIEHDVRKKNNQQMEAVLSQGFKNENKLLQLEINDARQKQSANNLRIAFLLVIIGLLLLGGLYYRNQLKQKTALADMREKISRNLHDDIGATLSSLHIYSELAKGSIEQKTAKSAEMLTRISEQSRMLMEHMNDMVWSMKTSETETMPLNTRIKNFGAELLTAQNIACRYEIDETAFNMFKSYEARKNILLILKEGMHNIAKYSHASKATIRLQRKNTDLHIGIEDNGKGFDMEQYKAGNGLKHMEARAREMGGSFHMHASPGKGTAIHIIIPIP